MPDDDWRALTREFDEVLGFESQVRKTKSNQTLLSESLWSQAYS
jgi:hypothetical protein